METKEIQSKIRAYIDAWNFTMEQTTSEAAASRVVAEFGKDRRTATLTAQPTRHRSTAPATERQLAYLRRLGVKLPVADLETLTREKASELIDYFIEQDAE